MSRNVTAAVLTEAARPQNEEIHLFEAYFDSGNVFATDAPFAIQWNGNTYGALGDLIDFSGLEENASMAETRTNLTLAGVDQRYVSLVLAEQYIDRRIVIYRAYLAGGGNVVVDPFPLFDGLMDAATVSEDVSEAQEPAQGEAKVKVEVEAGAHWSDFGRRPGRHTNDNEQQFFFPGDGFFRFCSEQTRQLKWGKP